MGRSLLKSQLERLSALEPKPYKAASVSKKANKKKQSRSKSKAKKISSPPPPPPKKPGDDNEAALGYFRATLTSKASEKARQAMSRALGL